MRNLPIILTFLLLPALAATDALAQTSAHYRLEESVFNAGGHPAQGTTLASASYSISMDSVGEALIAMNLSSASYHLDTGWATAYTPPGLVEGLRFVSRDVMEWTPHPSAGSYNLYRNKLIYLSDYGPCHEQNLTSATATDLEPPTRNVGFYYLVTVENRLTEEGGKGVDSQGDPRGGNWCP